MRKVLALLLLALPLSAQSIRPKAIIAHMRFLAGDLLEGRGTGTRGYAIAAEYVAAQYEAIGLEPGAGGSYFQSVPFRAAKPLTTSKVVIRNRNGEETPLEFTKDFLTSGDVLRPDAHASAPIVFVGFGVTAPEQKYDDYAGIDAKGKIVALLTGAPSNFPSTLRAHHSASQTKALNAAAHGAIGIFTIPTLEDEKSMRWERAVRQYKIGSMAWLENQETPHDIAPLQTAAIRLSHAAAAPLFRGAKLSFDELMKKAPEGKTESFDLPVTADIDINSTLMRTSSPNVIGILPGSDPVLRNEYVVYSSHLDHLGITDPVNGDSINNGAFDNASGVATMIEIARVFAGDKRPKRSIIFLATTGEEKGLKGADFFANNPTVPADKIVANINIDQIEMLGKSRDLVVYGAEHSELGILAEKVAKQMNIELSPDPFPEETIFVRSDQYPFVKRGIPAVFIVTGYKAVDAKVDLAKAQRDWSRSRYHSPSDDMQQPMDPAVAVMLGRFAYRLGAEVANRTERPRWNKGDYFGTKYGTAVTR